MKNLLESLKPKYQKQTWEFESLRDLLSRTYAIGNLTLSNIWMMEHEFNVSLKNISQIFDLFQDEEF